MPSDANNLSKDVEGLRISNVRSLSPNASGGENGFVWKDPTAKCVMCFSEIAKYKLKDHILTTHFSFYRPYKCKDCDYKCGDSDIYLQDHMMTTGHENGVEVVAAQLPHLERIMDMIYVHCRKLNLGDFENVNNHLMEIKDAALSYGETSKTPSYTPAAKTQNGTASKGTRSTGSSAALERELVTKSPGRSTFTSRRAIESAVMAAETADPPTKRKGSPSKRTLAKKRRSIAKNPNRKKSLFYKCKLCDCMTHVDERLEHTATCQGLDINDIDENSQAFDDCFGNAEEDYMTDPGASDDDGGGSNSDESYHPAAARDSSASPGVQRPRRRPGRPAKKQTFSNKDASSKSTGKDSDCEEQQIAPVTPAVALVSNDLDRTAMIPATPDSNASVNNLGVTSDDNVSNRSTPAQNSNPRILLITCDFCAKICENQDLLKAHCLEHHVGGFSAFYCSAPDCGIKDPSSRRLSDHCRSVHKNPKLMKKSVPTGEQKIKLLELKDSLAKKGIALDLTCYGIVSEEKVLPN